MPRVRRPAKAVLALVLLCLASGPVAVLPLHPDLAQAGVVAWPPSTLVVSEVQTGGSSASDEFVEIANQGGGPVDLVGLEVVYATASGSTVTRKATWAVSTVLDPGKRYLIANSVGSYVGFADSTYTGGFAATGGAIALRVVGGSVVDAIAWGDATNAFVEGAAAPAPPAGSSLERRPGGAAGNGTDTNDNAADFVVTTPNPQNIGAPAVPGGTPTPSPTATPSPSPTLVPTASPTPTATASPTPTPVGTPTPGPTITPMPDPTPTVTPEPTPTPTPTPPPSPSPSPTPTPTPTRTSSPTPTPTPTPSPTPVDVAAVRALPDGSSASIDAALTTDLGALESGRTAFVEDATGGIALYLEAPVVSALPTGTRITVRGTVDERYAQRTLRIAESDITVLAAVTLDAAPPIATGTATESWEGRRVAIEGSIVGGSDALADGTAVSVDDGSGPVRVVVTPAALAGRSLGSGMIVSAVGPLGQRDSSGTGTAGYRLYVTSAADLTITPAATATPTPAATPTPGPTDSPAPSDTPAPSGTPSPSVSATPSASPTVEPSPTPSATPSPSPSPTGSSILAARAQVVGTTVMVHGVVTAEAGRLGSPSLLAIGDASSGIVVRLPDGTPAVGRGQVLDITGPLADPYGQLEVRPAVGGVLVGATGALPSPFELAAGGPSESTEGRLVRIAGLVIARPTKATSGDITLTLETSDGTQLRVMADASSGVRTTSFELHARYRVTGIAGQRASKKGLPDGYRIWLRDVADIELLAPPPPGSSPTPAPSTTAKPKPTPTPAAGPSTVSIATALRVTDHDVGIEAVVTAPATLLDTSGRRIVVQDGSGAVEILLPKDARAPSVGTRVHAIGRIGTAYGAPRLRATRIESRGSASVPAALRLTGQLTVAHAWRLVSISGRVDGVRKLGDRWRAELVIGAQRLVVIGQPGSGIPNTALVDGGTAEVTGIVRLAYPSATDRRPAVLPRSPADVHASGGGPTGSAASGDSTGSTGPAGGHAAASSMLAASLAGIPDVDLADLATLLGRTVRVGGLVVDLDAAGFTLDDGTDQVRVELTGEAVASLDLVEPRDAINLVGRVDRIDGELRLVVSDPGALTLASSVEALAAAGTTKPTQEPSLEPTAVRSAGVAGPLGGPGAGFGLAGLGGICLVSAAITTLRRRQARRLSAGRVAVRLARLTRSDPTPDAAAGARPGS